MRLHAEYLDDGLRIGLKIKRHKKMRFRSNFSRGSISLATLFIRVGWNLSPHQGADVVDDITPGNENVLILRPTEGDI
jgi:hypothetical protein